MSSRNEVRLSDVQHLERNRYASDDFTYAMSFCNLVSAAWPHRIKYRAYKEILLEMSGRAILAAYTNVNMALVASV